jgi:two-component system, chemotaxis family, CheB/CheR fusion protein
VHEAMEKKHEVFYDGIKVRENGGYNLINLRVIPIKRPKQYMGMLAIIFEENAPLRDIMVAETEAAPNRTKRGERGRILQLERELKTTREHLQSASVEMKGYNEELKSANEEMQSSNEELQSTNEELETSREELQSVNEELVTVNSELQLKIEELTKSNNDLNNLMASTKTPSIFLDMDLRIRRFTPESVKLVNLIKSDIGRPFSNIVTNLEYASIVEDAEKVLDTLVPIEADVRSKKGDWYLMRIIPYRTTENVIDGVVMTFANISSLRKTQLEAQEARDYAESIVDTIREPMLVLDGKFMVISASRSFLKVFKIKESEVKGKKVFDIGNRQWNIPSLKRLLNVIISKDEPFMDYRVEHAFPKIGERVFLLNAKRLERRTAGTPMILLAMEDVTRSEKGK